MELSWANKLTYMLEPIGVGVLPVEIFLKNRKQKNLTNRPESAGQGAGGGDRRGDKGRYLLQCRQRVGSQDKTKDSGSSTPAA